MLKLLQAYYYSVKHGTVNGAIKIKLFDYRYILRYIYLLSTNQMRVFTKQHYKHYCKIINIRYRVETSFFSNRAIITNKGASWILEGHGIYITFSSKAVQTPKLVTCSLWSPIVVLPLLEDGERLVSNVIDLACNDPKGVNFNEVTVALAHSASDLGGYELVVREFTDSENTDWRDLKATKGTHTETSYWCFVL